MHHRRPQHNVRDRDLLQHGGELRLGHNRFSALVRYYRPHQRRDECGRQDDLVLRRLGRQRRLDHLRLYNPRPKYAAATAAGALPAAAGARSSPCGLRRPIIPLMLGSSWQHLPSRPRRERVPNQPARQQLHTAVPPRRRAGRRLLRGRQRVRYVEPQQLQPRRLGRL